MTIANHIKLIIALELLFVAMLISLSIWVANLLGSDRRQARFDRERARIAATLECGAYALPELRGAIQIDVRTGEIK